MNPTVVGAFGLGVLLVLPASVGCGQVRVDPRLSAEQNLQRLADAETGKRVAETVEVPIPPGVAPPSLELRPDVDAAARLSLEEV